MLSEDKISHLSLLIVQGVEKDSAVAWKKDRVQLLRVVKATLVGEMKREEEVDRVVKKKLASYARKIVEGSPEWDILYDKAFQEEIGKRRV